MAHWRIALKRLVAIVLAPLWKALGFLIPKEDSWIAISTFPDFDDTVRSLQTATQVRGKRLVVLTCARNYETPDWLDKTTTTICWRYGYVGIWLYHRCRIIIFTHGIFAFWTPNSRQIVVNVWHGTPIKNIGLLDGKEVWELPKSDYVLSQDKKFNDIIAKAFGVGGDRVINLVHPRLDLLTLVDNGNNPWKHVGKKIVVWLPTYRVSKIGDIRLDGSAAGDILLNRKLLSRFDSLMKEMDAVCIIKPHPMSKSQSLPNQSLERVLIIDNDHLASYGFGLYQLLGVADVLVTDLSSVYFDFKLTSRPIVLYFPDIDIYKTGRGFVAPVDRLVDEVICRTDLEFFDSVRLALCKEVLPKKTQSAPPSWVPIHGISLLERIDNLKK